MKTVILVSKSVFLASFIFFVLNSCLTEPEVKEPILKDPLIYLKDSVIFENTTYDFGSSNENVEYIKTSFEGKNTGQDSIKINCKGNFRTAPSQQVVPPRTAFSIGANRLIKGKRGQTSTNCTVTLSTLDDKLTYMVILTIDGYVHNDEKD